MSSTIVNTSLLQEKIKQTTGHRIMLNCEIKTYKDRWEQMKRMIIVRSEDIKNLCGIMSSAYKEVYISDFGQGEIDNSGVFWLSLHFTYSHVNGGSNGCEISSDLNRVLYDSNHNEWILEKKDIDAALNELHGTEK